MDVSVSDGSGLDVSVHDYMGSSHASFVDVEKGRVNADDFRMVGKVELEEGSVVREFVWEVADEFDGVLWLVSVDGLEEFEFMGVVVWDGTEFECRGAVSNRDFGGGGSLWVPEEACQCLSDLVAEGVVGADNGEDLVLFLIAGGGGAGAVPVAGLVLWVVVFEGAEAYD